MAVGLPGADVYSGFLIVGGYGSIYGMQRSCGAEVGFSFPRAAEEVYSVFTIDIYRDVEILENWRALE